MSMIWQCGAHRFQFSKPLILGIVNVTPDSFSDGGRFFSSPSAIEHGRKLIDDGADILDIGGESTRPNATPVSLDEELTRVLPVIRALASHIPISVDTMKAEVALQAIAAGACIVNDVAGLREPAMVEVCAKHGVGVIVNHMQGTPQTMQVLPSYDNVVREVDGFFAERIATLVNAGIPLEAIALDPGIGFGKSLEHTLVQLQHLHVHQQHARPVCLGVSRKGFLGQITGHSRHERLAATLAVNCFAMQARAAQILRVHDVQEHRDATMMYSAINV